MERLRIGFTFTVRTFLNIVFLIIGFLGNNVDYLLRHPVSQLLVEQHFVTQGIF